MASNGGKLRESLFFTEREAILPTHFRESRGGASTSSSSRYYSPRIHTLMECKSKLGMSEEAAEIEASKAHWTETKYVTATSEIDDSSMGDSSVTNCGEEQLSEEERVKLYVENVEVMHNLIGDQRGFNFKFGGTVGRKIGEGGQAEIYEGRILLKKCRDVDRVERVQESEMQIVMKVFKEGTALLELQKQWPTALFSILGCGDEWDDSRCSEIHNVTLLDNGRIGFEMIRCLGDLRKFLDVRMEHNGNLYPPLMKENGEYHEMCMLKMMLYVASAMESLHSAGILHRDLKASNILVTFEDWHNNPSKWEDIRLKLGQVEDKLRYLVADYECSLGVMGTRFWRAPEILQASNNQTLHSTPNIFTEKSDVYSYAMTCYEIFTGYIPFEDPVDGRTSIENVVEGKRPTLPSHLRPWVKELLHECWHTDPLVRPSFGDILLILELKCEREGSPSRYPWKISDGKAYRYKILNFPEHVDQSSLLAYSKLRDPDMRAGELEYSYTSKF